MENELKKLQKDFLKINGWINLDFDSISEAKEYISYLENLIIKYENK